MKLTRMRIGGQKDSFLDTRSQIILGDTEDRIVDSYIDDCEIISITDLFIISSIIESKDKIIMKNHAPPEPTPIINGCIIRNCEIPKNCYGVLNVVNSKPQSFDKKANENEV